MWGEARVLYAIPYSLKIDGNMIFVLFQLKKNYQSITIGGLYSPSALFSDQQSLETKLGTSDLYAGDCRMRG